MTLREALTEFLLQKKLAGLAETSLEDYANIIAIMIQKIGDIPIQDLTYTKVNGYIYSLCESRLSRSTVATYIRNARIFLRWLKEEYGLSFDPNKIKVPKSPKKIVKIYTDTEIRQIFAMVKTGTPWITARNCAIVALMLDSGIRQAEVCKLQRNGIDRERMLLKVVGKGAKERLVPLGSLAKMLLDNYLDVCPYSKDFVFLDRHGQPLSGNAVRLFMYKLQRQLPFELSSHKLRHNFATNFCINNLKKSGSTNIYDLSILMGHESVETTKKYEHFAHELIAAQRNVSHLDRVFDLEN